MTMVFHTSERLTPRRQEAASVGVDVVKGKPQSLLVGMSFDSVSMENSVATSQKVRIRCLYDQEYILPVLQTQNTKP